jgi:DNA anti-recombination protein RmuC
MIKKLEAWLRNIVRQEVAEEVQTCRDDFHGVAQRFEADAEAIETKFTADLKKFESTFEHALVDIETRITERLEELVTNTLERFDQKAQLIEQTISKELDHWQTDEETRKADHALRHPKPARR